MKNDALKLIYEQYSREIFLYVLSLCGNRATAEELMQETFVKALLSLPDSHSNARAWLYKVARNLFLDRARRSKFESPGLEEEGEGTAASPEELMIEKQENERLRMAVSRLDERKREVIRLHYFSELSFSEIASVMGLTLENVRVLAYRAKKELKKYLEDNQK